MNIRKATQKDALNISVVGACVWIDTYATEGVFNDISKYVEAEFTQQQIKHLIESKHVYVSNHNDSISGYIVLGQKINSKIEIENLYVLPKFQHQKLGSRFIQEASNIFSCPLWLSVWEENSNAINFYKKMGFEQQGEVFFELNGKKIRNIVFEK